MAQLSPDHALDDQIAKLAAELQEAGEHPKSGAGVQNVFLTKAGVQKVAVRCKVENASECQIKFQDKKDWEGRALEYPSPIDDCQSSRFAHVGQKGSIGGVVYRGDDFDFLLAWSCQRSCPSDNKVLSSTLRTYFDRCFYYIYHTFWITINSSNSFISN